MHTGVAVVEPPLCEPSETQVVVLPPSGYERVKAVFDLGAAVVLLVVLAPVILLAMLLVKLTSPGPALYTQMRLGRGGRPFRIYKIRSMHHDCERHSGPRWATSDDPRVTLVGWFLRLTHLDELPQLWNVLRGEMSLIGPRPERPEFVEQLERALPGYRGRLAVRPGITGLAQVQLPADTDLRSVRRKLICDLYYIERMNPLLEAQILLATVTKVVGIPCEAACKALRIPMESAITEARRLHGAADTPYRGFWPTRSDLDAVSA